MKLVCQTIPILKIIPSLVRNADRNKHYEKRHRERLCHRVREEEKAKEALCTWVLPVASAYYSIALCLLSCPLLALHSVI